MSVKTSASLARIADDAMEFVRYGNEQSRWLAALMKSIQRDLKHKIGMGADDLSILGLYLNQDCANYLDNQAGKQRIQLDAVGADQ